MMIVVAAAAAVTALGDLDETWQGLLAGHSALAPGPLDGSLHKWPVGAVRGLSSKVGLDARQEELIRLVLAGLPEIPVETGLVLSTTKGAVDELSVEGADDWPGQPWSLGGRIAATAGLQGQVSTVSAACASGTLAIIDAAQRLADENSEKAVLVFGIDILSNFVTSGFARLHALAKEQCRPFDRQRDGLSLGEGAAALLLTTDGEARRRNWPVLAAVSKWGVSCDAGHITAPCRDASGLLRALDLCTDAGRIRVGAVNAHGTGTKFNDAMEIKAFRQTWGDSVPFHSVKGAIGHCLGAAGVIEAAVAVKSLEAGLIPPTVGLEEADQEMGCVSGERSQELNVPSVLSCNSGFGGINAAVLFDRQEVA